MHNRQDVPWLGGLQAGAGHDLPAAHHARVSRIFDCKGVPGTFKPGRPPRRP